MRALACGWVNPGDKFKSPNDVAWWGARYKFPLWEGLSTWEGLLRKAKLDTTFNWNQKLADGDPAELSQAMLAVADELSTITAAGHDICAPYIIPESFGLLPKPNLVCIAKLKSKDEIDRRNKEKEAERQKRKDRDAIGVVGLVLVLGLVYVVAFHYKHGRTPWR